MHETPVLTLTHTDRHVHEVRVDGKFLPLSPLEKQLLGLLAWRPEVPVLRVDILEVLRVGQAVLNNTVCRLRKRLPKPFWVQSVRSRGQHDFGFAYSLFTNQVEWVEVQRLRRGRLPKLVIGWLPEPIGAGNPVC